MSDIENRLVALDPAAQAPYVHPDVDGLISRVTSINVAVESSHTWRNFKLKMASAVAASALITVGAVTAFTSGPALSALSLAKAIQPQTTRAGFGGPALSSAFAVAAPLQRYEQLHFVAGPRLDVATPSDNAYPIVGPNDPWSAAAQVAAAFDVTEQLTVSNNSTYWSGTSASGARFTYSDTGIGEWSYQDNSSGSVFTSMNASRAALPSKLTVENDVNQYMSALGFNYNLSAPSFGGSTTVTANNAGSSNYSSSKDVFYSVLVNGLATGFHVEFSFNSKNEVVSASGPAFVVGEPTAYPLRSIQNAISELNQQQQREYSGTGGDGTSHAPIATTTLNSSTVALSGFTTLTDGGWLLPTYEFTGVTKNADGSTSSGTWSVLAVDPSYINGSAKVHTFTISVNAKTLTTKHGGVVYINTPTP